MGIHILVINKLYTTFYNDIPYRISKQYIGFLVVTMITPFIFMTGYIVGLNDRTAIEFLDKSAVFVYAMMINDIITDICILALFIYQLRKLIMSTKDIKEYKSQPSMNIYFLRQQKLTHVMMKQYL